MIFLERVCKVFAKGYLTFRHIVGARAPRPRWNTSNPSAVGRVEMWQEMVIGRGDPAPMCSGKNFTRPLKRVCKVFATIKNIINRKKKIHSIENFTLDKKNIYKPGQSQRSQPIINHTIRQITK